MPWPRDDAALLVCNRRAAPPGRGPVGQHAGHRVGARSLGSMMFEAGSPGPSDPYADGRGALAFGQQAKLAAVDIVENLPRHSMSSAWRRPNSKVLGRRVPAVFSGSGMSPSRSVPVPSRGVRRAPPFLLRPRAPRSLAADERPRPGGRHSCPSASPNTSRTHQLTQASISKGMQPKPTPLRRPSAARRAPARPRIAWPIAAMSLTPRPEAVSILRDQHRP